MGGVALFFAGVKLVNYMGSYGKLGKSLRLIAANFFSILQVTVIKKFFLAINRAVVFKNYAISTVFWQGLGLFQ